MPEPIIRDLAHPAFPHGTTTGFRRGCARPDMCPSSPTCHQARRHQERAADYARLRGQGARTSADATEALRHTAALLEAVPTANYHLIAEVAGVDPKSFTNMRSRGRSTVRNVARILAVTPVQMHAAAEVADAELVRYMVRRMQAAGYPMAWQVARTGCPGLPNLVSIARKHTKFCRRWTFTAVADLFDLVGDREADPVRDGIDLAQIRRAKTVGQRAGYYPPAAYDEDGMLDLRLWPEHPWCVADRAAARNVDLLHALATIGVREGQWNARASVGETDDSGKKLCQRLVARSGLSFVDDKRRELTTSSIASLNATTIRRIVAVHAEYAVGLLSAVEAALALGVAPRRLPLDHPDAVAHQAAREAVAA